MDYFSRRGEISFLVLNKCLYVNYMSFFMHTVMWWNSGIFTHDDSNSCLRPRKYTGPLFIGSFTWYGCCKEAKHLTACWMISGFLYLAEVSSDSPGLAAWYRLFAAGCVQVEEWLAELLLATQLLGSPGGTAPRIWCMSGWLHSHPATWNPQKQHNSR